MIIILGKHLYGKVDKLPERFSVQTEFFHLWYLPLVPLRSYVVVVKGNRLHARMRKSFKSSLMGGIPLPGIDVNGARIRMSLKSVLMAWTRAAIIIACFLSVVWITDGLRHWLASTPNGSAWSFLNPLGMLAGFVIFYALSHRFAYASYERALELADQLGLGREIVEEVWATTSTDADVIAREGGASD